MAGSQWHLGGSVFGLEVSFCAGHCGKQFRVRNGVVARSFTHACPSCGTKVCSAKASGRIRVKHNKPNGKVCPTTVWVRKWRALVKPSKTMQMCCSNSTFETAKSIEVPVVGTRPKRKALARFQPKGWRIVAADRCPNSTFETAKSMEVPVVGKHAKRQSPSRSPAQPAKDRRPDRGLTYPLNPSNSCRKPSKTHLLGSHKIGRKSSRTDDWKHFQTVGLEKRKRRKQDSSCGSKRGAQTRLRNR